MKADEQDFKYHKNLCHELKIKPSVVFAMIKGVTRSNLKRWQHIFILINVSVSFAKRYLCS